jgi:hypothetical protein
VAASAADDEGGEEGLGRVRGTARAADDGVVEDQRSKGGRKGWRAVTGSLLAFHVSCELARSPAFRTLTRSAMLAFMRVMIGKAMGQTNVIKGDFVNYGVSPALVRSRWPNWTAWHFQNSAPRPALDIVRPWRWLAVDHDAAGPDNRR